jgi:hypothetical protein
MEKNTAVLVYLSNHFPKNNTLSISRLCKMVYLADWKSSIYYRRQITTFNWEVFYSGPYSEEFEELFIKNDELFKISKEIIAGCGNIRIIECKKSVEISNFLQDDIFILDQVLNTTSELDWDSFIKIVYSTYPVAMKDRYTKIDLPKLAEEYKYIKRSIVFA